MLTKGTLPVYNGKDIRTIGALYKQHSTAFFSVMKL